MTGRYSETINLLYSSATFITSSVEVVVNLPRILLPQRLDMNKSFRFDWPLRTPPFAPPYHISAYPTIIARVERLQDEWCNVWETLASMKGLKTLHVKLCETSNANWQTMDEKITVYLLGPVKSVMTPKDFVLQVGFECDVTQYPWNTLPCHVIINREVPWFWVSCAQDAPDALRIRIRVYGTSYLI